MKSLFVLLTVFSYSFLQATNIYVDASYSGKETGSSNEPFSSISQAIQSANGNDVIIVRDGTYRETVEGKDNISIQAEGSFVNITGTEKVDNWHVFSSGIYKAYLPQKCTNVFRDGIPQMKARYPNTATNKSGFEFSTFEVDYNDSIVTLIPENLIDRSWQGATMWLLTAHRWVAQTGLISDVVNNQIHLKHVSYNNNGEGIAYLTNTFQALDTVGEWHWQNDTLYYYFGTESDINSHLIEAQVREHVLDISNKRNITITGIHTYGGNILMENTDNSTVSECTFLHLNNYNFIDKRMYSWYSSWSRHKWTNALSHGIGIGIFGNNNTIDNCHIAYSSGDCITVYGNNNIISNSIIHDANYLACDMAPISVGGIGNTITHNTIYNGGRGIVTALSAQKLICKYNRMYNAGLLNWDIGVFYTFDTDGDNSEIAHNYIYNATPSNPETTWGGHGIYLDNNSRNYSVHHNVVWNCKGDGIRFNMPANNLHAFNNTTFNCEDMTTYLHPDYAHLSSSNCSFYNNYIDGKLLTQESWLSNSNNVSSSEDFLTDRHNENFLPIGGSSLIDAGIIIQEEYTYTGQAPDIGAYEQGRPEWKVGPYSLEDIPTSLQDEIHNETANLYPNPVQNSLQLPNHSTWKLINLCGQTILQGYSDQIDMSDIDSGTYLLKLVEVCKTYSIIKL